MLYDEKTAVKACEEEPSLIFTLIRNGKYEIVDKIISDNIIDINTIDSNGDDVMMKLLKAHEYDLVLKFMRKRSWKVNHQNFDGNTFGHILAKDNSIAALKVVEQLVKKQNYISNIKNKNGETSLDKAINSHYTYTAFKILEDKRFNNIDLLSFRNLYNAYIKNTYYGKYSKINNLEIIVDSLKKKELVPSLEELVQSIIDNIDSIKSGIMNNNSLVLESIINSYY
ncbi:MAG: hypothetical protein E7160_03745 [Firmicutes bacterium]|nr:hypothetical protein [Bacillota bacterium]